MPKTDREILQARADLYRQVRSFFFERDVLEVDAPLLARAAVTDLHIESIPAQVVQQGVLNNYYLITSPEFHLKRLLSQVAADMYYLGKVFRQGEHGARHHHEFTMLEWYRCGWSEQALMKEVEALLLQFLPAMPVRYVSYRELFVKKFALDPHEATEKELRACVADGLSVHELSTWSARDCLDVLFSHLVEPVLSGITFVTEFPVCQAALARTGLNNQQQSIARRFEVFLDQMELANGYYELTDPVEQRRRFEEDLRLRKAQGRVLYPIDQALLAAQGKGLPDCAGVALGIDRLLMKMLSLDVLQQSLPGFAGGE